MIAATLGGSVLVCATPAIAAQTMPRQTEVIISHNVASADYTFKHKHYAYHHNGHYYNHREKKKGSWYYY